MRESWLAATLFARRTSHQLPLWDQPRVAHLRCTGTHCTRTVYMRLGPEGQSAGAEFKVLTVKSPILSMEKLRLPGCSGTDWVQNVQRGSQRDVGCCRELFSLGGRQSFTTSEGARNADARLVAAVVSELPVSSSGPTTPSFQTARAPRGSSVEYRDSSSPVEDMRSRFAIVTNTSVGHTNTNVASRTGEK